MESISDGMYTLGQTEAAIRYEEARGFMLVAMSPGPESAFVGGRRGPVNYESFVDLQEPGAQPARLELEEIGTDRAALEAIARRHAQGWELATFGAIHVQGVLVRVGAFRLRG